MKNEMFVDALKEKGYTPYLCEMFGRMLEDLQARSSELSKLTGFNFIVNIE